MSTSTSKKQQILQQIAAIPAMEHGKLSSYSFKDRPGANGPYYKLQSWESGKNHTRSVPADQVSEVEAAVAGYQLFEQLTSQYADLLIAETRAHLADSKKNSLHRRPSFSPSKKKFSG